MQDPIEISIKRFACPECGERGQLEARVESEVFLEQQVGRIGKDGHYNQISRKEEICGYGNADVHIRCPNEACGYGARLAEFNETEAFQKTYRRAEQGRIQRSRARAAIQKL